MADDVHVHQTPPPPPPPASGGGGSAGWVVAILLVFVLAIVLWFVFGRGGGNEVPEQVDVEISVPDGGN
jgi:hypothetical protein